MLALPHWWHWAIVDHYGVASGSYYAPLRRPTLAAQYLFVSACVLKKVTSSSSLVTTDTSPSHSIRQFQTVLRYGIIPGARASAFITQMR
jgi:hypothetical protein